ncbi:hypothetical protein KIH31_06795 [Paenarthrobacter sp. DKR-5]|uniref:cell division protein PerM n=1 Tax=Paenarthrobacter sp. DKR-5 TaxID=2835535 RepID=UPI001BDC570C|nr:DUF6350 family protein [Paenarthrobacter sp. DKR-5]MBT1002306.1 hypothetical protein [Paenarthrobacter sp. DKR-5]
MKLKADQTGQRGLPMPLWLQGGLEAAQAAVISALLAMVPLAGVWIADGFSNRTMDSLARLAGQAWLLIHAVPLELGPGAGASGRPGSGLLSLIPLGLTLIPFLLSWRAGRRLAKASYTDQLWQALLGAGAVYAAAGAATAYFCSGPDVSANLAAAAVVPLVPVGLGLVFGSRREAGAWGRLIGVDAAAWVARTSQHSRWAGSYVWSALRAGALAVVAALALSGVLLAADLALHWSDMTAVYEGLGAGAVGGAVLTIAQLGFIPNLVVWTLSWASGAGITLGAGSVSGPLVTAVGPLPAVPVLGAIPAGRMDYGLVGVVLPVLAGVLAGWWFIREGENHFDEWLAIKIKARWFTAAASTLALGLFIGAVAAVLAGAAAWLSHGSAGIGRLTDVGPDFLATAVWVGAEVAIGAVIGCAFAPWLERVRPGSAG